MSSPSPTDRKTRTAALTSLRTFLGAKHIATALTTLDVLKLWKGLFYALWMCDRPLPQQQLCADLSLGLLLEGVFPDDRPEVVRAWLRGFWATMAREWTTGIDVLRMEKFLLLVRRMLGASLVWMRRREPSPAPAGKKGSAAARKKRAADGAEKKAEEASSLPRWDKERVEIVLALLADWPLRPDEETKDSGEEEDGELMPKFVPTGLKLHVLDIWVDEADKAGLIVEGEGDEKKKEEEDVLSGRVVIERINELVEKLKAETRSTAVRIRSKESLADDRLPWNKKEGGEDGEDGEWGGLDD